MGWFDEILLEFLDELKDEHLMDLPTEQGGKSLYSNKFLRLDRQNVSTDTTSSAFEMRTNLIRDIDH